MKYSRSAVHRKTHALPTLRFEDQTLTSFAGLVLVQAFFAFIGLKERLRGCFSHLERHAIFGHATIFLQLVVHLLLGFRELRDSRYYRDDPLLLRVLGLRKLPDVATISRTLATFCAESVVKLRHVLRSLVLERLVVLPQPRVTLDFDGSVLHTKRHAEGTAVGFCKAKKGARSYYPLFCTIAQTGQVFDVLHRSGNVHDSNGAKDFILACVSHVRAAAPHAVLEVRMDAAFFSDEIVKKLHDEGIEFTISVPFERFAELKGMIESRCTWYWMTAEQSYFEIRWKPKCWNRRFRFLVIRTRARKQRKGPVQLDLFVPYEYGYEFKVIVTNKQVSARTVVAYHEGRGSQEGIFGEMKSQLEVGYVPAKRRIANEIFLLAGLFAHNLMRELQMLTRAPERRTSVKRPALWIFERVQTLRRNLLQRAGRLTRPQGELTLTMSGNRQVQDDLLRYLGAVTEAA